MFQIYIRRMLIGFASRKSSSAKCKLAPAVRQFAGYESNFTTTQVKITSGSSHIAAGKIQFAPHNFKFTTGDCKPVFYLFKFILRFLSD
jgi:hypothetical protein